MSEILVIVESPAKAKTIGRFLGKKYTVKYSMGHVRDLPKSQLGVDIEEGFLPRYITIRGKGELLKELKAAAKRSSMVLLATDPDREGEAIAWHLQQVLGIEQLEKCRIEFNEITKNAIQQAVQNPRTIDFDRVNAQQARRILDRLVGYGLSPLLWKKVRKGLSAGRVQSVAVRLICDREKEINQFIPEEYWSLTALLKSKPAGKIEAKLIKKANEPIKISSQAEMDQVLSEIQGQEYRVVEIKKKEKKRNPAAPFTTSSLQQEAYRKLNFTARKTMMIAQQLYEGIDLGKKEGTVGLITYLRTDSTRIAAVAQEEARSYILDKFGKEYVPSIPREYTSKKQAQNAHEAIRPTSTLRTPESLSDVLSKDQYKLYKLIWERFVASQMSSAILDTTTVDIAAADYLFRANGAIIKFPGFMQVYTESREGDSEEDAGILPDLQEGTILILQKLEPKQHFTQPPPRYSEATLVKTLEELGIGRPSTYAPTIETILQRGYVVREQKQFAPTELGMVVVELLKEYFPDIIDVEFTANMESNLDEVEEGAMDWQVVVDTFYRPFAKELEQAEKEIGSIEIADQVSEEICESCGRNMVIKMGRYGKFLACPGFPECRNTKPLLEEIGVPCPKCEGKIVLRRTKKGRKFFGCSNYPECDYVSWDKPTTELCPECHSTLVLKNIKKGSRLVCPKEGCHFEKEVKQ
ncbi:type I DNA topoisomerase [Zhaonella formicivorans]|uniref:type I DNA topoisomerase n=1 Tax=Zhaonella formicivorans TaxID=2528593 RepID=UPI0010D98A75|nr:type I DNA topoisomerase [Zhaonella formicivorans]